MEYIHVKSLDKYHPGYKDRTLQWAKIYFTMVQGNPDCEMIDNEIDWGRLIKFILLELAAQKPLPLNDKYFIKKGFDIKKRPIYATINMLHNFLEVVTTNVDIPTKVCSIDKEKDKEKDKEEEKKDASHPPYVFLTETALKTLTDEFGKDTIDDYIARLNDYIEQIGVQKAKNKYKSHSATIRNWLRRDGITKNSDKVDNPLKEYEVRK